MSKYAEGTSVSVGQSRSDIEHTLERYGATGFMYGQQGNVTMIAFEMKGRRIRLTLTYPPMESFMRTKGNVRRSPAQAKQVYDQEIRRLWRGLVMIIKAKLEAIDAGVSTLEDEFMANVVMPNNQTVGEWLEPQIKEVYRTGKMPPLLPGLTNQKMIEGPQGYIEGEVIP